jgi:hypothetical protein
MGSDAPMPPARRHPPGPVAIPARALLGGLVALAGLAGCQSYPTRAEIAGSVAAVPVTAGEPAFRDGRARFREIFCAIAARDGAAAADDPACETALWRLADEPLPSEQPRPLPPIDPSLRFFLVTGALSDCFGADALPYREGVERLAATGVAVGTLRVSGRSGASHNARQIAGVLADALDPADRVVLVGYSKGAVDILHFLDEFPDAARQVVAVVSLAGPIHGSQLAERGAWIYDHLLSGAFANRCDPGDGGIADSMRPDVRREWLATHPLPPGVAYFSVAAFTTRAHLAWALRPSWRLLAAGDRRNDGQVLPGDALVPGSTLLGYPNADHWGLAIAIERELPRLMKRPEGNVVPQPVLLEAILRQVSETLAAGGAAS